MRTVRELVWLTQLGLSIVCPLLLCLLGAVWLRDRFGFGNWVIFLGIALGLGGAFSAGAAFGTDRGGKREITGRNLPYPSMSMINLFGGALVCPLEIRYIGKPPPLP